MKKLFLLAFAAFALDAHAQLNNAWTTVQSISGGIYKTKNCGLLINWYQVPGTGTSCVAGNEYFESTGDSVKGVVRAFDSTGAVLWTTVIPQIASLLDFPVLDGNLGGVPINYLDGSSKDAAYIIIPFNVNSTTSRLVRVDTASGAILWNIQLTNINRVSSFILDTVGNIYLTGRTTETDSAGIKSSGIAIAKYNLSGLLQWKKTKYTTGYRTAPASLVVDNDGNIIVCGKKAPRLNQGTDYDKTFVTKYSNAGTALWTKEFTETTTSGGAMDIAVDANNDLRLVEDTTTGLLEPSGEAEKDNTAVSMRLPIDIENKNALITTNVQVRKLSGSNGTVEWTKTINNAALNGISIIGDNGLNVFTSIGIKHYDASGTLGYSDRYIVVAAARPTNDSAEIYLVVAKHVSLTEPLSNFLLELDANTGTVLFQKNLSFGNHEEYMGDVAGLALIDHYAIGLLSNDTTSPYGIRLTALRTCDNFTYSFSKSASAVNVNNATCDNGQISLSWSGAFNSWAHIELWKGNTKISETDPVSSPYIFTNLLAATYSLTIFDESCGEQDTTVTIKCPAPSTGLATTNITSTSAKANWNAPTCNNTFRIQYRQTGTTAWTTVSGIAGNNYIITGLTSGLSYRWKVATKCNSTGTAVYSNYSVTKSFTTLAPQLATAQTVLGTNDVGITISPNPAKNNFTVELQNFDNSSNKILRIINTSGQIVKEINIKQKPTINISIESAGVYSVQLITDTKTITKKLVVVQ